MIRTAGSDSLQTLVGWAQLLTSANISGFTVLRQIIGTTFEDAEVPIETRNASAYVVPFDDTIGFDTGIALANTSAQPGTIMVTVRDDAGAVLLASTISLAADGHASFDLAGLYPLTAGIRGTVEFDAPTNGSISVLGPGGPTRQVSARFQQWQNSGGDCIRGCLPPGRN